ncbi:hypothetical protein CEV32_1786 [Brucella rhizosphaerae]|uniref:Uncharacterized protein n=1 Tax=Brucella rhizosphaerae TaxID=571254 RepID=A0A256F3D1_9HYPH|nr:hypothetical protein CEV32_1786 [Brucella rhizosphaerae]
MDSLSPEILYRQYILGELFVPAQEKLSSQSLICFTEG